MFFPRQAAKTGGVDTVHKANNVCCEWRMRRELELDEWKLFETRTTSGYGSISFLRAVGFVESELSIYKIHDSLKEHTSYDLQCSSLLIT